MSGFLTGLLLGRPGMVCPQGRYDQGPVRRVLVLEHGRAPSADIYLRPRLTGAGLPPVEFVDIAAREPMAADDLDRTLVVVCRYIEEPWLRLLEASRSRLAGVVYFTDDDLPAAICDRGLPARYRRKIDQLYGRHATALSALASQLWVSTEVLAAKYAALGAKVVPPVYVSGPAEAAQTVRYFYHGTAAHGREIAWLVDVVAEVQQRNDITVFEVFGDQSVRRLFRGIERVVAIHPMTWLDYLSYAATAPQHIGLAPLLPSAVNAARSPSKFFDIARFGAAGIYSAVAPYVPFVRNQRDGILLANHKDLWIEAILDLAADPGRRAALARAALLRCRREASGARPLPGFTAPGAAAPPASVYL